MVYRFSEGDEGLYPDEAGDWVEYADYKALDEDFQDYITCTNMELEELREKLRLSS